jgi:hypothetical protein
MGRKSMSSPTTARQGYEKLSIVRLACTLSTFMAISFVLCVVFGFLLPGLRGVMPVTFFPGFSWEQPLTAVLGVLWSLGFGVYVAVLFGVLYNAFGGVGRVK